MNNILYVIGDSLYLNLTNRCPCSCTFCLRNTKDKMGDSQSLWLKDGEPSVDEVISQLSQRNLDEYKNIVFCGFGEPLVRLDAVCEIARYIRSVCKTKIRVNTNGLCDRVFNRDITPDLDGLVDVISISLNATNPTDYLAITRSVFGITSFESMLNFTKNAKKHIPTVVLSVVDVISAEEIELSRKIAEEIGVEFRVRAFEE